MKKMTNIFGILKKPIVGYTHTHAHTQTHVVLRFCCPLNKKSKAESIPPLRDTSKKKLKLEVYHESTTSHHTISTVPNLYQSRSG